ncbi:hypothetical protein ACFV0O_00075 [Kitasatospora sp. NPDC059577]|uniref:hypothetical protein n=1 Tax=Kitasatospora sp. NPDC059577 TaxID=3346873 RepID=UPI0036C5836B
MKRALFAHPFTGEPGLKGSSAARTVTAAVEYRELPCGTDNLHLADPSVHQDDDIVTQIDILQLGRRYRVEYRPGPEDHRQ